MEYRTVDVAELQPFAIRDLRPDVLSKLKERISKGYNPARPLSVIRNNGTYIVADGNHRLKVLQELGISQVPCVIYDDQDPYSLAVRCNQDEDTYAPMDLFDWLDIIGRLRNQGLTQREIAERIGWRRELVKHYIAVHTNVGTQVLRLARNNQEGRVPSNGTIVPFNFTEGWFRNSGIYDLRPRYQLLLMRRFIEDGCKWSSSKVKKEAAKYKDWQSYKKLAAASLYQLRDIKTVFRLIDSGVFKNEAQLQQKISDLNRAAQNKLICGDAVAELEKLDDGIIDIVITDPPYGQEYVSNRSQFSDHITRDGVINDSLEEATRLLNAVCEVLTRKTKPDAHLYFFCSWKVYPQFAAIISTYFELKNLLIWDKGNHGCGDLEGGWANQYEMIIFATKGNRKLVKRKSDVVRINRVPAEKMIHPTQKPVELIEELLDASARPADTVCDPFMGSGATIKAVKKRGDLRYIGIELDPGIFEKAKAFVGGQQ